MGKCRNCAQRHIVEGIISKLMGIFTMQCRDKIKVLSCVDGGGHPLKENIINGLDSEVASYKCWL